MVSQNEKMTTDLDKLRTALMTKLENLTKSQMSAIDDANNASKVYEQRIQALESSLEAEKRRASHQSRRSRVALMNLGQAKKELRESISLCEARQKLLDVAKQKNVDLQVELELAKSQPADLQKRLDAADQRNLDLQADLKAVRQRASTAEDQVKALQTRFNQVKEIMNTHDCSSEHTQPQPASSPAPFSTPQDRMEESQHEPQTQDHPCLTSGLDSHMKSNTSDKVSDLLHCQSILDELMDVKNEQYNHYFLKTMDSPTLPSINARVGPMTLGAMKEKLTRGFYLSGASFKADFDTMIEDCRRLNRPRTAVRNAAERLSKIFEQMSSTQPNSTKQPPGSVSTPQETWNRKRKAASEGRVSSEDLHPPKRLLSAPLEQSANHVQTVNPGTGGSLIPALSPSDQPQDSSHSPGKTRPCHVKSQIMNATLPDLHTKLSTVAQLVSLPSSPSTITGDWKSMIPAKYELTACVGTSKVIDHISALGHGIGSDVIILRLMPTAEADKLEFDRIFKYLNRNGRFGAVNHGWLKNVEVIYLIPASKAVSYPDFFSTLDHHLLPPKKTEDVLFMAVVFNVAADKQRQVRNAWDRRMMAIRNHGIDALASMRHVLIRSPLLIFRGRKTILSSANHHLAALSDLPYSTKIAGPELESYDQHILCLSYPSCHLVSQLSVDGVGAPEWVFVLGSVVLKGSPKNTLVVDIQKKNRPLWVIGQGASDRMGHTLTLLANKFPESLKEWEDTIPAMGGIRNKEGKNCIKNIGLKLERCRPPE